MKNHGSRIYLKIIKTWTQFHDAFIKYWESRKDGSLLLTQFHEIKNNDFETIQEVDQRFHGLVKLIPKYPKSPYVDIFLQYTNNFEGQFCFSLRDKYLNYLSQAKQYSIVKS
jgi:hypothetical protein